MIKACICLLLACASSSFTAELEPKFKSVIATGTGCLKDTVEITFGEKEQNFQLSFNDFVVEPSRVESLTKTCTVLATIAVPQHVSVSVLSTSFNVDYIFTGSSLGRAAIDMLFAGRKGSESIVLGREGSAAIRTGELGWSACGDDIDVQYVIKITAKKGSRLDTARAMVANSQSVDLAWRACR